MVVSSIKSFGRYCTFMTQVFRIPEKWRESLLSISETAGLGMRAEEVLKPQFAGKNVAKFAYSKSGASADNEIDAISGATITTNAVTNGVNAGLYYFQTVLGGGDGQ